MTHRIATCSCGQLSVECSGEPARVVVCHCTWCQRRTGSAFGVGAYFPNESVQTRGESRVFSREAPEGRAIVNHFCPQCGTSVFWFGDLFRTLVGVAGGCFEDASGFRPVRAVWSQHRHGWVELDAEIEDYPQAVPR